ncbi:MAG TPA: cytochrome C oxidase subunit I [Chitinophagales bacterium]|nr:cytochrome C oxidase subunit I [Chitinophagales bacterium]HMY42048.1 cytochrome C oxidase subunit I [Chitinophagales bacterium]HMZ67975.1 cytochrome C oxidase subunit I [Chitinophagales bacterium]HNB39352.1 cytochrome C oxidase subunit I [Chitinophagales bacterium]HND45470.1 cytochrome C oxidase subunit I [Chitinophagales bacterium]
MIGSLVGNGLQQTTSYKVVIPFYVYAAVSLLIGTILLFFHTDIAHQHYFHPYTLAITHTMALGWGTMIIFGASHQLLPVLVEGKLDSNLLAYLTFIFAAIGIPFLVAGFYMFQMGWLVQLGAILINIAVICYLTNVIMSIYNSKKYNIHAWFIATASLWLFSTTFFGLLLVFNFTRSILPKDSVAYLTIHAHLGIVGWFLLLVIGVGSRLIPMFLISKYTNDKTLWQIFILINLSLVGFIIFKLMNCPTTYYYIVLALGLIGIALFGNFCRMAHKVRIRKSVDEQMKVSLLSVLQMLFPIIALLIVIILFPSKKYADMSILYGFCIFFGWLTAIILGMTFKTLPFIVWNKVYSKKAHAGRTPVPKDLFNENIFNGMTLAYILGFILFITGMILSLNIVLKIATIALVLAASLYVSNITIILLHKPNIK